MKVELISYTPDALDLLLFTKNTRLMSDPEGLDSVSGWSEERKMMELNYMKGTNPGSWEFVDYVFLITGVSRAFTHQLVRTRTGSYAQQSQRTVDMSDADYVMPKHNDPEVNDLIRQGMEATIYAYRALVEGDVPPQVARSILPTNVSTNIVAKFNLRSLSDMAKVRLCTRTQGEYQDVFREMRSRVIEVHSWAEPFIRVYCGTHGTCCFPHYLECPIKQHTYNPHTGKAWGGKVHDRNNKAPLSPDSIQMVWENTRFEAVPKSGDKNERTGQE